MPKDWKVLIWGSALTAAALWLAAGALAFQAVTAFDAAVSVPKSDVCQWAEEEWISRSPMEVELGSTQTCMVDEESFGYWSSERNRILNTQFQCSLGLAALLALAPVLAFGLFQAWERFRAKWALSLSIGWRP